MQNDLLDQGLLLMVFGMGTVFVFLAILVVVTIAMSAMVKRFSPPVDVPSQGVPSTPDGAQQPKAVSAKRMAIIAAAIQQHRAK